MMCLTPLPSNEEETFGEIMECWQSKKQFKLFSSLYNLSPLVDFSKVSKFLCVGNRVHLLEIIFFQKKKALGK